MPVTWNHLLTCDGLSCIIERKIRLKHGDVVIVNFGEYRGNIHGGIRPAIVVGNDVGNTYSPTIFVTPVTSVKKCDMVTHVHVEKGDGGLNMDSTALAEQTQLVNRDQILKRVGSLAKETIANVDKALYRNFFGVDN